MSEKIRYIETDNRKPLTVEDDNGEVIALRNSLNFNLHYGIDLVEEELMLPADPAKAELILKQRENHTKRKAKRRNQIKKNGKPPGKSRFTENELEDYAYKEKLNRLVNKKSTRGKI